MFSQSQQNRLLEFVAPKGVDGLVLTKIKGTESLSNSFCFELTLLTDLTDIEANQFLEESVTFHIHQEPAGTRTFNGIVRSFQKISVDYLGHSLYQAEIVPWFDELKLTRNCRIFQDKTIVQLFSDICQEAGYVDFDISRLGDTYEPKEYCVQYNETLYDFLNRHLEEAGIYYTYVHTMDKHTLTLLDRKSSREVYKDPINYSNVHHSEEHLHEWMPTDRFHADKISAGDDEFKIPQIFLETTRIDPTSNNAMSQADIEIYDYPGDFRTREEGQAVTQLKAQSLLWKSHLIKAKGNVLFLNPAQEFSLDHADKPGENGDYFAVSITHEAHDTTHLSHEKQEGEAEQSYMNELLCHPSVFNHVPKTKTPRQRLNHTQTAVVTGPADMPIYTDQYGQVKVQFHWDPDGKKDENSSCWLRTSQMICGDRWGAQLIPRTTEEVVVAFKHGDSDRPVIIGSAYNSTHPELYPLPEQQAQSGIRTRIEDGQKTKPRRGHELRWNDQPGGEAFDFRSEGDLAIDILHDQDQQIDAKETLYIQAESLLRLLEGDSELSSSEICLKSGASEVKLGALGSAIKPSGKVHLLAKGVSAAKPIARVGDDHSCPKNEPIPHNGGPVLEGSPVSKANSQPIARVGDPLHCDSSKDTITKGIPTITADDKPIAIETSQTDHGGQIKAGSPNVYVGKSQGKTILIPSLLPQEDQEPQIVELLYETKTQTFYALTQEEEKEYLAAVKELHEPVQTVHEAVADTSKERQEKIDQAKQELNETLKPFVHEGKNTDITEVISHKGHRWTYVDSKKMKSHWRKYKLNPDKKYRALISTDDRLDYHKLKQRILDHSKGEIKWEKDFGGSLGGFAESMNKDLDTVLYGNPDDPNDRFDVTDKAQILRYTAGAGLSGSFHPSQNTFSFSTEANTSFTLYSGRLGIDCYIPDQSGWKLSVPCPTKKGMEVIDFGAIRVGFDLALVDFVGASVLANVEMELSLGKSDKDPNKKRLMLKGTNQRKKPPEEKEGKEKEEPVVTIGADAFLGVKAGCEAGANLSWQSPEASLEWKEFAAIKAEGDAAVGVGGAANFEIQFDRNTGKFLIHAKAGLICGGGLSGEIEVVVYAEHIVEFVRFIYHKIMNEDYRYIGFIAEEAFGALINLLTKFIFSEETSLMNIAEKGLEDIIQWWRNVKGYFESNPKLAQVENLASHLIQNPDKLKFTLPEVKGRLLFMLTEPGLVEEIKQQIRLQLRIPYGFSLYESEVDKTAQAQMQQIEEAILYVMSYIQSHDDYINVMQHMTLGDEKVSVTESEKRLYNGLGIYGRSKAKKLKTIREIIEDKSKTVIYPIKPNIDQPVKPNPAIIDLIKE